MYELKAQMAGVVYEICVNVGDKISKGQTVIILESMKMQISFESEVDGVIKKIVVQEGEFVNEEDVLLEIQKE